MATKKATTTDDLTASPEELTASAEATDPSREDLVSGVEENTDPDMVADVNAPKTYKVKSPAGTVTEVPESILDALLASGYSKSK